MKTDSMLQKEVMAELHWEPSINAAQIGVEVKNGIVTLSGHIDSYAEKWRAEKAAQRVHGVKALVIEMDVLLPSQYQRSDITIANALNNILDWATYIKKDDIHVMVENGWVTLTGTLEWEYQKKSVLQLVQQVKGILGVHDRITIKPKVSAVAIKGDIEAALKRRALSEAGDIRVEVKGNDVILSGKVHSLVDRTLVERCAWDAAGVGNVIDNLIVS
jgi:osmotically-inducible protein OsmY